MLAPAHDSKSAGACMRGLLPTGAFRSARSGPGGFAQSCFTCQTARPSLRRAKRRSNPAFRLWHQPGCLRRACHRARVGATRWLAMTAKNTFAFPRRASVRVVEKTFRPRERGRAGMPDAQCTRSLVCAGVVKNAHEYSQRSHRKSPGIPARNGFNGFLRDLPGDQALLSPSSAAP